tara:strand:+ start:782 stop:1006 length:225 start_codon:yes stop_codon:yes gene_type:complete
MEITDLVQEVPEDIQKEYKQELKDNQPYVDEFCKKGYVLLRVDLLHEKGFPELAYEFSDNLGLYLIQGIKDSLN